MLKFALILTILVVLGCEKPNPTPELGDGVYSDLISRAETAGKSVEAEKKKLEGFKKDLESAKPQTGDTKIAQKRYFESEKKIALLQQEAHYLELHAEARKTYVRKAYIDGFNAKKPWNGDSDTQAYNINRKLSQQPQSWDESARIQAYQKETGFGPTPGAKKAEGEKPAAPKEE